MVQGTILNHILSLYFYTHHHALIAFARYLEGGQPTWASAIYNQNLPLNCRLNAIHPNGDRLCFLKFMFVKNSILKN